MLTPAAVESHLINALNARGWTPLALALYHGHLDCTRALLEVHADPLECAPTAQQLMNPGTDSVFNVLLKFVRETNLESKQKHLLGLDTVVNSDGGSLDQLARIATIAVVERDAHRGVAKLSRWEFARSFFDGSTSRDVAQRRSDADAERSPDEKITEMQDAHLQIAKEFVRLPPNEGDGVAGEGFDLVYDALDALGMFGAAGEQLSLDFTACCGGSQWVGFPSRVHARGGLYALRLPTDTTHVDSLHVARDELQLIAEHTARESFQYRPSGHVAGQAGSYVWLIVGDARAFNRLIAKLYRGELVCTQIMFLPALAQLPRDPAFVNACRKERGGDGNEVEVENDGGDGSSDDRLAHEPWKPAAAAVVAVVALVALVALIATHHLARPTSWYAIVATAGVGVGVLLIVLACAPNASVHLCCRRSSISAEAGSELTESDKPDDFKPDDFEFKLDLAEAWTEPPVCVVVPHSAGMRDPDNNKLGYTGDAFFDELGVKLDAAGVVTAVRPHSRAARGWREHEDQLAGRGRRRPTVRPSVTRIAEAMVRPKRGSGEQEDSTDDLIARMGMEQRLNDVVQTGLRITKVGHGPSQSRKAQIGGNASEVAPVTGRAEAVRQFADLLVERPDGIALLPASPPPTAESAGRVDKWHEIKQDTHRTARRSLRRHSSMLTVFRRKPSAEENSNNAEMEEFLKAPHEEGGAPPAAEIEMSHNGTNSYSSLSLFDDAESGDDEDTSVRGFGLHRSNLIGPDAPISAEDAFVDFDNDETESWRLRHRPLGWLFGLSRTSGGLGGSRFRRSTGDGGGGAPPVAEADLGVCDDDGSRLAAGSKISQDDPGPAWLEKDAGPLNFSETKVLLSRTGVEVTAYKLVPDEKANVPPGWVLDRSINGDSRAAPWLCTRLKAGRDSHVAVLFSAPLHASDASQRNGDEGGNRENDRVKLPRADDDRESDTDNAVGSGHTRAIVDPLRVEMQFRYVARRCACTLRLGRFVSSSPVSPSSSPSTDDDVDRTQGTGACARPASLRIEPPGPPENNGRGWTLDAMDVLQSAGARPEDPAMARRARTSSNAAFVIDLTMLVSARRLTDQAKGELLSLVELRYIALDSFGIARVRALRVSSAHPELLCEQLEKVRSGVAATFPPSFINWFVAVNNRKPTSLNRHLRRRGGVRALIGCGGRLRGNAAVWGGGVGAVIAGAVADPWGRIAASFDGESVGDAFAWLRRRRVLRQQLVLHAMLVGAATRQRLRRDPAYSLGLESARFHDKRTAERHRSLYGRRSLAEDVALSAYDTGLLRIHQQGRRLKVLEKDLRLSDTSAPVKRATIALAVAHDGMQVQSANHLLTRYFESNAFWCVQALHLASMGARGHRAKFVYYYLFDPFKPTMLRYIIFVFTLTLLAYFSSTGSLMQIDARRGRDGRAHSFWAQAAVANLATGDAIPGGEENHEVCVHLFVLSANRTAAVFFSNDLSRQVEYFQDIENAEALYDFLVGPFYDNVLSSGDGFMDEHNQLVGAVAVRQVRVRPRATCGDESLTSDSEAVCYDYERYDKSPLVVNGTSYAWTVFDGLDSKYGMLWKGWENAERSSPRYGKYESPIWRSYPFEGIVEYLPSKDNHGAAAKLAWMRDHEWVDPSASAVFVDYTVLNPSLQRLIAVELAIELPETGLALPRSRVVVLPRLHWLRFRFESLSFRLSAWAMVGGVLVYVVRGLADELYDLCRLFISALHRIVRHGYGARLRFALLRIGWRLILAGYFALAEYMNDIYNFFDILAASLVVGWWHSWMWMVLRARELEIDLAVGTSASANDPTGAHYYAMNERVVPLLQHANDLIALGIFFSYIKVIKYIRLIPIIGPAVQAVTATIANLRVVTFLIFFIFFTCSFTFGVNIAFGDQLVIYQDWLTAFLSVFAQQLGDSALADMQQKRYFVGTILYFLMAVIGTIVLTNIFIGVVSSAYEEMHGASQSAWEEELYPKMVQPILRRFARPKKVWGRFARSLAMLGHPLAALRAAPKLTKKTLSDAV